MIGRRTVLAGGAAVGLALAGRSAAAAGPFFSRQGLPIGLQLFSVLPDLNRDLEGTLKKVAAIGYRTVETGGAIERSAADLRAALDAAGLACRSMHVQGRPLLGRGQSLAGDLDRVVADARTLGASDIVVPLFLFPDGYRAPVGIGTLDAIRAAGAMLAAADYRRMAAFLNAQGALLRDRGLRLSYHNHNTEFAPLAGGGTGYDLLLRETDPRLVHFELDAGWAAVARVDVAHLLAAHPGRFTQMHVKDIAAATPPNFELRQQPAVIGEGAVDWARILPAAYSVGVRGFYVEHEAPFTGERIDVVAADYRHLAMVRAA